MAADKNKMRMLREQGLKHREIAEICGVSTQYVSMVCFGKEPAHYIPVSEKCVYPNLRKWMNDNKITRSTLLKMMGLAVHATNYDRLDKYIRGVRYPRKNYIDKLLAVTGMTYETLFYTEGEDGKVSV